MKIQQPWRIKQTLNIKYTEILYICLGQMVVFIDLKIKQTRRIKQTLSIKYTLFVVYNTNNKFKFSSQVVISFNFS